MTIPLNARDKMLQDANANRIVGTDLSSQTNRVYAQRAEPFSTASYDLRVNDIWIDQGSKNYATFTSEFSAANGYSIGTTAAGNMSTTVLNDIAGPLTYLTGSSLVADRFVENTNTAGRYISKAINWSIVGLGIHTVSIYIKAAPGALRYFELVVLAGVAGTNKFTSFDIVNGAVINSTSGVVNAACASVGNGWFRCSMAVDILTANNSFLQLRLSDVDTSFGHAYLGDGASGVYAWGLMVEANTTLPGKYIDNSTSSIPGVLDTTNNNIMYTWNGSYWLSARLKELDDLSSDNVLTPAEKSVVLKELDEILEEQVSLSDLAVTYVDMDPSLQAIYDAAVADLLVYLNSLNNPYPYTDLTVGHNTNIDGEIFRQNFSIFYAARDKFRSDLNLEAAKKANWEKILGIPHSDITTVNVANDLGFNPLFEHWTGTMPDGWIAIGGTAAVQKETTIKRYGSRSLKAYNVPTNVGVDEYYKQTITWDSTPLPINSYITGSIDIYIVSRTAGFPGIEARVYGGPGGTDGIGVYIAASTAVGKWQTIPFSILIGNNKQIYGLTLYLFASFGSTAPFISNAFAGTVLFDNIKVNVHTKEAIEKASWPSIYGSYKPENSANNVGVASSNLPAGAISLVSGLDETKKLYYLKSILSSDESLLDLYSTTDNNSVVIDSHGSEVDHIMLDYDFSSNNTTFSDVTGLELYVNANTTYSITGALLVYTADTDAGVKLGLTIPSGAAYNMTPVAAAAPYLVTSHYIISAIVIVGNTAGYVKLKFASEDSNLVTLKTNSYLRLNKLKNITASTGNVFTIDTSEVINNKTYSVSNYTTVSGAIVSLYIYININGTIDITINPGSVLSGTGLIYTSDTWGTPIGGSDPQNFEIKITTTITSGSPSISNPMSSYQKLDIDRIFSVTDSCVYGSSDFSSITLTIEVRKRGTDTPLYYASGITINLTTVSENYGGGTGGTGDAP